MNESRRQGAEAPPADRTGASALTLLGRKTARARVVLLFERIWRALLRPLAVAGIFLTLSLFGVWVHLPPLAHQAGLALFALAFLWSLAPLFRIEIPTREEGLRRLEQSSGVPHRPASSYDDILPENATPSQKALWEEHRRRIAAGLARLRTGVPHPRLDILDPRALRAALLLALVISFATAGRDAPRRLAESLRIAPEPITLASARVDAWVTPPVYTGRPPVVLADGTQSQEVRRIEAPVKSLLVVRMAGPRAGRPSLAIARAGGGKPETVSPVAEDDKAAEFKVTLEQDATVSLRTTSHSLSTWHFELIPDKPPLASFSEEPGPTPRAALRFGFKVEDDYGVASALARIELEEAGADAQGRKPEPLVLPLTLPRVNSKIGESRMYKDLTAHPWAGLPVRMVIAARDQAGQDGESEPASFILPARKFTKPMAKALVEQRRKLVQTPADRDKVSAALDALAIAPEKFIDDYGIYLGLRSVYWRLKNARTPEQLDSVVEHLWQLALTIEDGDVPEAEAALRQAQERLQQALENGAPDEEIQRLLQELREALSNFLQALAEQAQRNGMAMDPRSLNAQQMLSSQDLDQLLRNIENLAKTGAKDLAQQLLSELRNLMERLQMGAMSQNSEANRMMNMVDGLGDIITRQQGLLDDTFQTQRRGGGEQQGGGEQGQLGQGQQGQQGKGGQQGQGQGQRQGQGQGQAQQGEGGRFGELSRRQGEIRQALDGLLEQLRGFGMKPPDQLEGAARAMREAEKALEENNLDRATQQQTLALDRLRQGTQSLAQQVMQGMAIRLGQGADAPRDPFGRPERTQGPDLGTSVKVPDEIDIQRAREILEELRRRLSEPTRPLIELDYLERLLKQF